MLAWKVARPVSGVYELTEAYVGVTTNADGPSGTD